MDAVLLEIKELGFTYGAGTPGGTGKKALRGISCTARAGERIGLIGANGAGKSTLLKLLVGLEDLQEGSISVCGLPLEKKNLPQIRSSLGYVFQDSDSQLFMARVEDDLAFAPRNYGFSEEETQQRVQKAMQAVGIENLAGRSIHKLSGGEKKLAAIATILTTDPQVILMDEPSAALDPKNRRNLIRVINGLPQLKILASHDLDFILDTCDRVLLLSAGQIVADGPAREILRDRELLEANGLELPLSYSRRDDER